MLDLMPFLEAIYKTNVRDVREVVAAYEGQDIPTAFRCHPYLHALCHIRLTYCIDAST